MDDLGVPSFQETTIYNLVGGFNPSEKILVSWAEYSQHMEKQKMFQTTNQYWVHHGISWYNWYINQESGYIHGIIRLGMLTSSDLGPIKQ